MSKIQKTIELRKHLGKKITIFQLELKPTIIRPHPSQTPSAVAPPPHPPLIQTPTTVDPNPTLR